MLGQGSEMGLGTRWGVGGPPGALGPAPGRRQRAGREGTWATRAGTGHTLSFLGNRLPLLPATLRLSWGTRWL